MPRVRFLGVLLCYNDGDILADAIQHLLNNNHDVVVWNHGSTDETAAVLAGFKRHLLEVTDISREVDFYDLYPLMSKHLMKSYVPRYDWISWPDQDEILEGPTRTKPYCEFVEEVAASSHSWIEFNDFVYWFTERDDPAVASPCERVRHYSLARHGAMKVRSWRASATNIRWFNHNKAGGTRYPSMFNLRHYPMRSASQMQRRISVDRAGLQHGPVNYHYENMKAILPTIQVRAEDLHFDDGVAELDRSMRFDWTTIYGSGPKMPRDVVESYLLSTKRWEIAAILKRSLSSVPAEALAEHGSERVDRWLQALDDRIGCPIVVALKRDEAKIVTEELADQWAAQQLPADDVETPIQIRSVDAVLGTTPVSVWADSGTRSVRIVLRNDASEAFPSRLPLVALVPCYSGDPARIATFEAGAAEFRGLNGIYFYLTSEPDAALDSSRLATPGIELAAQAAGGRQG